MIEIAGDMLEGGGQIVRTSLALAALTGNEVRVTKIRDRRPNPGLQAQHVTATKALASICNAETQGLQQGSRELTFKPRNHVGGRISFDVGTAGSISLILQALMPSAAFAPDPVEFDLTGGTDVRWSPSIDYVRFVVLPALELMGYRAGLRVIRRGHYPKGGGRVVMTVEPSRALTPIKLLDAEPWGLVEGVSHCVRLPSHVAQRQALAAKQKLNSNGFEDVNIVLETYPPDHDPHFAPGSGITLYAKSPSGAVIGADSLGERGKAAEAVGEEAASNLLFEFRSKAPVDRHMGDMLIPYMTVAEGRSEISVSEITMHTFTNIRVAELITSVKFMVEGNLGTAGKISVVGVGLKT